MLGRRSELLLTCDQVTSHEAKGRSGDLAQYDKGSLTLMIADTLT